MHNLRQGLQERKRLTKKETNLLNHLRRNHADYEQDAQEAARRQNPLNLRLDSQRTRDLYRWLEWVISDREFVERRLTRQNPPPLYCVGGHVVEVCQARE
ncbi:hypothetical protein PHYPSEUDO_012564 [Phytophthora pseudosyringae]|uniref:Uncharacterized protein n=1 Tax=Phytophthora pseudosyringae TaxID=221518 RepID=A0A8T1V9A8_9STRA|nr:hypothetical protein PHYPSEUDO_012564 [Phytophthora pseudosyringae]